MFHKTKVNQLWLAQEAAFATDPSADGSQYKFLKTVAPPTLQLSAEVIARAGERGDLVRQPHVVGALAASLAFQLELKGSGTPAGSAVLATEAEAHALLAGALGSALKGTGSTVSAVAGTTATLLKMTSVAGYEVGMAVCVAGEVRIITVKGALELTLNRALSAIPAQGTVVYASTMFKRAIDAVKSFAVTVKLAGQVEYTLLGGKAAVKVTSLNARGTALLDVVIEFDRYAASTKASLPSTAALTGINAVKAPVVKGIECSVGGAARLITAMEFDPGLQVSFIESAIAVNNRAGIIVTGSEPKGALKPYWETAGEESLLTDFKAGAEREVAVGVGDQSNGLAIWAPKAQYTDVAFEDRAGVRGLNVPFACNDNGASPDYTISLF